MPDAVTRNPYTGTNWEGVGVVPDVDIDPKDAQAGVVVAATMAGAAAAAPATDGQVAAEAVGRRTSSHAQPA